MKLNMKYFHFRTNFLEYKKFKVIGNNFSACIPERSDDQLFVLEAESTGSARFPGDAMPPKGSEIRRWPPMALLLLPRHVH